jgi:hypothetical protein
MKEEGLAPLCDSQTFYGEFDGRRNRVPVMIGGK